MKTPFYFLLLTTTVLSCRSGSDALVNGEETQPGNKKKGIAIPANKYGVEGFYTGSFTATEYDETKEVIDNKITLCVDSLSRELLYGHTVVAGINRPFKGSYKKDGRKWQVTAAEPGDNATDGIFDFIIDTKDRMCRGTWQARSKSLSVTERTYKLEKRSYKYDASLELPEELVGEIIYDSFNEDNDAESITEDVLKCNASRKLLTAHDVENLYKGDLEIIRNAVYARHGYSFNNLRMRTLFDNYVKWYMPVATNVTAYLTETEKKNVELIKRYEAHAGKYYDAFGR
jgi:hypothetical protein